MRCCSHSVTNSPVIKDPCKAWGEPNAVTSTSRHSQIRKVAYDLQACGDGFMTNCSMTKIIKVMIGGKLLTPKDDKALGKWKVPSNNEQEGEVI